MSALLTAEFFSQPPSIHARLAAFNARRLRPGLPSADWQQAIRDEERLRLQEGYFLEQERAAAEPWLTELPTDPDAFMQWFEQLRETGPGQHDRLFAWLANDVSYDEMRWFLKQEVAGEAGFDDLVALTQVRLDEQPKLEMARNYWDEMGRGHIHGMHGGMLARTADAFRLDELIIEPVWEAVALANVMAGLACNRRYAYQSIGALGVIEMTAPGRVSQVNDGLRRLGASAEARQYFQLHAGLDVRHSQAWNREVIRPIVAADPAFARGIAEGAVMRLRGGERCFERYRAELGVP